MNNIMANIKNLRDITGAGFLDCKKALEANDQSIEKTIDYLRKKGLAKANKKSSRQTNEGAIGLYSNDAITDAGFGSCTGFNVTNNGVSPVMP